MTKTKTQTIGEVAQEMLDNMEWKAREDNTPYVCCKNSVDWQTDIIHKAHGDKLPDDNVYRWINNILSTLADNDCETEESAQDLLYEMEPDVYTSDLTAWLNARNDHVYYLTQALEEHDCKDGFQALTLAQKCYIEEIGRALIDGITRHIEA